MLIASPTPPARSHGYLLSLLLQVGQPYQSFISFFVHDGPDRYLEEEVVSRPTAPVRAFAVATALGTELRVVPVLDEGVVVWSRTEVDGATPPAVATVRPTVRNEFFAAKAQAPVASVTGSN